MQANLPTAAGDSIISVSPKSIAASVESRRFIVVSSSFPRFNMNNESIPRSILEVLGEEVEEERRALGSRQVKSVFSKWMQLGKPIDAEATTQMGLVEWVIVWGARGWWVSG